MRKEERITYHANGNKESHLVYINDLLHGKACWFDEGGNLSCEVSYEEGLRSGMSYLYDEGQLSAEAIYIRGELQGDVKWFKLN